MNKISFAVILCTVVCFCKSAELKPLNFDREARALQQKINDNSYTFYHEKHPPKIEVPIVISNDFRSEREFRSGSYVYLLQIDDTGKFSHRALKPPPAYLAANIETVLNSLKFRPAWIGPKNFAAELEIHFHIEYEAY